MSDINFGFGAPLSEGATVFGMRHAENQPENFQLLTGDSAEIQRGAASEASMIRVVPQDEWEAAGFIIGEYKGVDVVVQAFDKTEQLIERQKQKEVPAVDAKELTLEDIQKRLSSLESENKRLRAERDNTDVAKADKNDKKLLGEEAAKSLEAANKKSKAK